MLFDISKLDHRPVLLDHDVDVGEIRLPDGNEVACRAHVDGELRKHGSRVDLTADYAAQVDLVCGRCLIRFQFPLEAGFRYRLVPSAPPDLEVAEENAGEPELYPLEAETLDLAEVLREQVDLGLPLRAICREDCRGLCSGCGVDLNKETCCCAPATDDRWSGLAGLRAKLAKSESSDEGGATKEK